jgi:membrane-bound ClpP family serine protease
MSEKLPEKEFAFHKQNYILLLIGIVIVIIGFFLMSGGGSEDPTQFSEEIFSARRITIAPIVVLIGYGFVMYAIMKRPKENT